MLVINLGPLGRFEIRRQRSASPEMSSSESTPLIATHNEAPPHIMSLAHEVPPPYSVIARNNLGLLAIRRASERQTPKGSERLEREEKATIHELPRNGPGKARKPACPQRQLRRYMLEIIALTFDADFDVLNNALHDDKSIQNTTSILSAEERKDLLVLSKLVGKALRLNNAVSRRRPLPISDKNRLQEAIVGPDEGFQGDIFEGFALDMIGWYSEPLPYPVPWGKTIPGYWELNDCTDPDLLERYGNDVPEWAIDQAPVHSLRQFKRAIGWAAPNEAVKAVLEKAFEKRLRGDVYQDLDAFESYWVVRKGYRELHAALLDGHKQYVNGTRSCKCLKCAPPWKRPRTLPNPKAVVQKTMLRRYVLEVISLTLSSCMDFDALNAALYDDKSIKRTNTTLSVVERAKLLRLSSLTRRAVAANGITRSLNALERQELREAVIEPCHGIPGGGAFALGLIGWYGGPLIRSMSWDKTIPGLWAINDNTNCRWEKDARPIESLLAFRKAIHDCAPNTKAEAILNKALDDCYYRYEHPKRRHGYHRYEAGECATSYRPVEKRYADLYADLKG
jgi:hypothetical protein